MCGLQSKLHSHRFVLNRWVPLDQSVLVMGATSRQELNWESGHIFVRLGVQFLTLCKSNYNGNFYEALWLIDWDLLFSWNPDLHTQGMICRLHVHNIHIVGTWQALPFVWTVPPLLSRQLLSEPWAASVDYILPAAQFSHGFFSLWNGMMRRSIVDVFNLEMKQRYIFMLGFSSFVPTCNAWSIQNFNYSTRCELWICYINAWTPSSCFEVKLLLSMRTALKPQTY